MHTEEPPTKKPKKRTRNVSTWDKLKENLTHQERENPFRL